MSNRQHLIPALERLNTAVVACVGDLMLDRFVYGDAQRISPEAPIPVESAKANSAPELRKAAVRVKASQRHRPITRSNRPPRT